MSDITLKTRSDIAVEDQWDLTALFKSDNDWEVLFQQAEQQAGKYSGFRGKLHESPETLKEAIDFDLAMSREVEQLYTYAHLKNDEDKTNQSYLGMFQKATNLYTKVSELSSFLSPEIQSIDDDIMTSFLSNDIFKDFSFYFEKILRNKPHTLSNEVEEILAMTGPMAQAPSQVFSQLDNADLKFGVMTDDKGKSVELTHGNFITFLQSPDRSIRKQSFLQYYSTYENHKHSISTTLSSSVKKDYFYSRVRKFESCRKSALFRDNISDAVYDNLIDTVKANMGSHLKYLGFRKEALAIDELHFYDTYVPIISDVDFKMPYEEAVDVCLKAIEPLGEEYCRVMREGLLDKGWVDRYENKGKRSGAYSSGCYDSPPYILLNYEETNINSLYTLMHEAGHSMHSYLSKKNQPYHYYNYTIFVAEVASTFNETLLSNYLLDYYEDNPKMKAYIINREIDNIRATLYRQTMFAEFEKLTHERVEKDLPLTLDDMTQIYRGLLETYFGDKLVIDDELCLECLRIPHFYSAFYVYKYATGISAAIALADKVLSEGKPAAEAYLNFLKLGGSKFPIDELKDAGVDMSTPEPIANALKRFDKSIDKFVTIYKEL